MLIIAFAAATVRTQDSAAMGDMHRERATLALNYLDRCLETIFTDLSSETRQEFCECSADAASANLSFNDLQALTQNTGNKPDPRKVDLAIIAPCLAAPAAELETRACERNSMFAHFFTTQEAFDKMCACMAKGAADYVAAYGPDLAAYVMERYPSDKSNLAQKIMREVSYREELSKKADECMNSFAYQ